MAISSSSKDQAERFREAARQVGADEADDALDRAMGKLNLRAKPKREGEAKVQPKDEAGS